ncbi:MAG: hypothetical protein BWK72_19395 [Rhodoferax ferrireducens]|uniref:Ice-binding protein C-terminal domain-containing protein n=1 Tax=Rhodoferax ferrireducens TaxID=192843 RepID=A0A1W9KPD8_9BURK|nr:MAG: hypothetical protein BWK72_19395 [Rhodoferax ferrireducens]
MKIKKLASAVVIALSSLAANAAVTATAPVYVSGASFADVLLATFSLGVASEVSGALGFAPFVRIAPGFEIALPTVTFSSVSAYNTSLLTTTSAVMAGDHFTFSNLAAGSYNLLAAGSVPGFNFIGAQFTVSAVPEPETVAMLLAGLGLVGGFARRRSQASVA